MTSLEIANVVNGDPMKANVDVKDREDGKRINAALQDSETHAFVTVIGALAQVSEKARARILTHVTEYYQDQPTTP